MAGEASSRILKTGNGLHFELICFSICKCSMRSRHSEFQGSNTQEPPASSEGAYGFELV